MILTYKQIIQKSLNGLTVLLCIRILNKDVYTSDLFILFYNTSSIFTLLLIAYKL